MSEEQNAKPLEKMTVKDLRDLAKDELPDVAGVHAMKKEDLLAMINEARGVSPVEKKKAAPKKKKSPSEAKLLSVSEMKALMAQLRLEKNTAKQNKDNATANKLRRRINILRKKTRKVPQTAA